MTSPTGELAATLTERAKAWLASLLPDQRDTAVFAADDAVRRDWAYFPRDHKGLPLHDMDRAQQKLAQALLAAGLSLHAYARTTSIMALESVLNEMEGRRLDHWRDPGRYFFSLFGTPDDSTWAFQVEGHHVNLNYALVEGSLVSVTPNFLGSNPASVRHGDTPVVRPCAEEEDLGRELFLSLDESQRGHAVLSAQAPPDFILLNAPEVPESAMPGDAGGFPPLQQALRSLPEDQRQALAFSRSTPKGLPAGMMTNAQRDALARLVRVYIDRLPDHAASAEMQRVDLDALHFAWAGPDRPGAGHYYRIQGGPLVIEYDKTQDGANHVHAVWRDAKRDFGGDSLRAHIARDHR